MANWLITGANRGIGLGLTRKLLARGERVFAGCRAPDAAGNLQTLKECHGSTLTVLAIDVTSQASVTAAAAQIKAPLDVLVNNAGVYGPRDRQGLRDMDFAAFEEVLKVNVLAPLRVTQAFAPHVEQAKGKVVTISSQMGSFAGAATGALAYRTSKAAVNKMMQGVAGELSGQGVTCIVMHPGWVRTDMGGAGATLSIEESTDGIIKVIDSLTLADAGTFRNHDGSTIAW